MRRVLLFAILSFASVIVCGQNTIMGTVIDRDSREPLPYATVYINGTTKGTTTNSYGQFILNDVTFPSTVVFSFVGYQTEARTLVENPYDMSVELVTRNELPQVVVSGDERKKNLAYFKMLFLGEDRWGENAIIKNEDNLYFLSEYGPNIDIHVKDDVETDEYLEHFKQSVDTIPSVLMALNPQHITFISMNRNTIRSFKAWADKPIIIDLPLLGYELYVDLVDFTVQNNDKGLQCTTLGYFYYRPYVVEKPSKIRKYNKNRRLAYYNSSQHFLRSLYEGRLKENGFKLLYGTEDADSVYRYRRYYPLNINRHFTKVEDNRMIAHGLNDLKLKIIYYHKADDSPVALKDDDDFSSDFYESGIYFMEDTCLFLKDGIVSNNSIVFRGSIADKKVASCLPDDYVPVK